MNRLRFVLCLGFALTLAAAGCTDDPVDSPSGSDASADDVAEGDTSTDDTSGSEDTDDDTAAEDSGGEDSSGEDTGGEDTGGEDTGGEDTGGEDTGGEDIGGEDTGGEDSGGEDVTDDADGDVAEDTSDDADTTEDTTEDSGGGTEGIIGVNFTFDSSGGFSGMGNRDVRLADGEMTVTPAGGSACVADLSVSQRTTLLNAAAEVSWATLEDDYLPPENRECCCDMFIYGLALTYSQIGASGGAISVDWCDQSITDDLLPPAFESFIGAINSVADAVAATCE